ncbi:MAG: SpoIID/LytB domain-containing protein [Candidatus Omnitrophota bacterium]
MFGKIISAFLICEFLLPVGGASGADNRGTHMIRVCIAAGIDSFKLSVKGAYEIQTLYTGETLKRSRKSLKACEVLPVKSGISVGDELFRVFAIRVVPTVRGVVHLDNRQFRGIIDIIRTKEMKLLVINHVDVEDYLYGVLYYETPHYWPMETLMAQAVAARTFAMYRKEEMIEGDYDLTNDTYSQMYGGKEGERWRTKRAVDGTRGEVLKYKGVILPAYYHSSCGGHTENAKTVWGVDLAPLKGRECPYCERVKSSRWRAMFSYKQMEDRLNSNGIKCLGLSYIVEGPRNDSGRLETVRIKDNSGVIDIPSNKFRLALGPGLIRSTAFTINITPRGVVFEGTGWGHGVGMCQWGALGMAQKGSHYKDILKFYYPGATIEKI